MLLDREPELATLRRLVDALDERAGKVVLIRGEAGIGKSALVQAFLRSQNDDVSSLYGGCDDLFIPQPWGPFWDIARSEATLRPALEAGDRSRLLDALVDLLARPTRPTILVIEDTHWADEATFDTIRYLGRRIGRTNGLLLLTYRDGEVDDDHPLRRVIGDIPPGDVVRLHLDGLSLEAIAKIAADTPLDAHEILRATRGNPLLVTEMVFGSGDPASSSLSDSLLARLKRMTIASQEALKALSVIPEPIPRSDALRLPGVDTERLDECEQRGFLEPSDDMVTFRHDLIRRAVESVMSTSQRHAKLRAALAALPEETHPCLLIHCASEVKDIDRLIDLAPRSARYAAAAGSHIQAAEDFREVGPYLDRFAPGDLGPLLDAWAHEEFLVDDVAEAIRINGLARDHYRRIGDPGAESRALAHAAHYCENDGQRARAEELAAEAVAVLGAEPTGMDLARALEVNAYLQTMAGDAEAVFELVDATIEAGGPDIDDAILVRSLVHRGIMANVVAYPTGRVSLDQARDRAEATGQWYEASRAPFLHASAAAEAYDLGVASDYAKRALVTAVRHEMPNLEVYARALNARIAELMGRWDEAADLAREVLDASAISLMVALPILGGIEARKGRGSARDVLMRAWEKASQADEMQRLAPAAVAVAEYGWISGESIVPVERVASVMLAGVDKGFAWSSGRIAFWLWQIGEITAAPAGIAEPFRLMIDGQSLAAARIWEARGAPYERALALMHGTASDKLEGLESLASLGAAAVASRYRKVLRDQGITVPRGKGQATRAHAAGLTARQAEVLLLLADGLSNTEIADRLFISPRTVENHVSAVLDKFDVLTRDEAVDHARAAGLIQG